ncbi:ABC transporter substrate-binding protein [Actinoplanes auranticolor]|uniref:Sugar ABC transporter substrate-binding protein n=1 Tax=Actinoplanes auranticolor TaxID=47988 RepID=A0A919SHG6_9ACTN|nr:ABC transporter substrate-binding protein [Actinoplanes auranticolor]GIM71960.1 sugar ABC transporter substrate-binding protein [Actinoplanes auranticolor]
MRLSRRIAAAALAITTLLPMSACGGNEDSADGDAVEVFTWWADGGEKAGLDALVGVFAQQCPDQTFQNGAVAGGAGSNAKQVLASRLQTGAPPDTFQAHAGAELVDYVKAGQVENLSDAYDQWALRQAFPLGLIENLTYEGRIYSVPANIHRANVVWTNKKVLADAGVTTAPTSMDEFFAALDKVKRSGIEAPLAVGKDWTQLMLLEAVLISDLGPHKFAGLWNGATDWKGAEVTKATNDYKRLLTYANDDRDALDWTDAERLLMNGRAAFQLMGDWEAADLDAKGFKDYGYFTFPGNGETFQWLADSFTLPRNAPNPDGARCWLKTVGSAAGQQAFNTQKGSIPARIDADPANYPPYQQSAMADWKTATQVPSCAHGAACSQGLQGAANSAMAKFSTDLDIASLQNALAQATSQFTTS